MSLRDRILQASDITAETVEVPEWGVTVEVRTMTGAERAKIMQSAAEAGGVMDFTKIYPDVVISCTFDPESGERVFDWEDRPNLMAKSGLAIDRIAAVGLRLSGFTKEAQDAAGKGSSLTPSDAPTTN
jgi:hypothetical protein